jgi:hypothetical protein
MNRHGKGDNAQRDRLFAGGIEVTGFASLRRGMEIELF